jgi:hypothetical protein
MADPRDDLQLAIAEASDRVGVGKQAFVPAENNQDPIALASALLRKASLQASAVLALSRTEFPESAIPNLRSLLEAMGELSYLSKAADPPQEAAVAFLYALGELRDYQSKWGADPARLKALEDELAAKSAGHPLAAAQAAKRGSYWTPKTRTDLIDEAINEGITAAGGGDAKGEGRKFYKLLSWDEHHVMGLFLVLDVNAGSPTLGQIKRQEAPHSPETFLPFMAGACLSQMILVYDAFLARLRS